MLLHSLTGASPPKNSCSSVEVGDHPHHTHSTLVISLVTTALLQDLQFAALTTTLPFVSEPTGSGRSRKIRFSRFPGSGLKTFFVSEVSKIGRTPKGAYSSSGRSRHLLEIAFSEPLLRTLPRTLFYCKTHSSPPSQNPSENPFPRTLPRTLLRTLCCRTPP